MLVLFMPRPHKHKFLVAHREMRMQPWGILREGSNVLLATLWLVGLLMVLIDHNLLYNNSKNSNCPNFEHCTLLYLVQ